jgi:tetratricopeptide (TPR) repeat protein
VGGKVRNRIWISTVIVIVGFAILWFRGQISSESSVKLESGISANSPADIEVSVVPSIAKSSENRMVEEPLRKIIHFKENTQPARDQGLIELTKENFEKSVLECFKGRECSLMEDPLKLYMDFKLAGNALANDQLISFLRKNLKDKDFRDRYKEPLKQMINDFYPSEEKQFQEAAYYNYLGDLQKSLDLYLDLEKKAARDPSLRPAPNLNIANTLYDLGRYSEALPYYEAALSEYTDGEQEVVHSNRNELVRFIDERISKIKSKRNA